MGQAANIEAKIIGGFVPGRKVTDARVGPGILTEAVGGRQRLIAAALEALIFIQ
jgi:hypothetical protein